MVVFRTSEYFHAWLLYTPPTTPTLYANFALLLGNILGAFFNVVAPIHDVELVKGIEPSLSDWKSEVLPLLNYTCIREVVLMSFPSHGAHGRTRTDTVSLPRDFLTTLCHHSQSYDCCSLDSIFTICFRT